MAMSKTISVGSIVIGCSLLVLTVISVICGAVSMSKVSSHASTFSVGLWALYFAIPGVLSIVAGHGKLQSMLGVALATHILGIILGIAGVAVAAVQWAILGSTCGLNSRFLANDRCICLRGNTAYTYHVSCSDLESVRGATGGVTIIFAFITIVSFVGSIYGCMGTCCAPREPVVVVTTQMVASQPGQQPPPYGKGQY